MRETAVWRKEEVAAGWIERGGFAASALAALLLTGVLAGDVVALVLAAVPPSWLLTLLRVGPVVALVLGAIGSYATWHHWLRLLIRFIIRREKPDERKELEGLAEDQALNVPGYADDAVRAHGRELRGCRARLQGCQTQAALLLVAVAAGVTVATFGPAPLRVLAVPRAPSVASHSTGPRSPGTPGSSGSSSAFAPPTGPVSFGTFRSVTPVPLPVQGGESSIAVSPDGSLWMASRGGGSQGSQITRVSPAGTVTTFPLPTPSADASGITLGPDGNLWFTEVGVPVDDPAFGQTIPDGAIARITPAGAITEFPLPLPGPNTDSTSLPANIVAGRDGNLWFVESENFSFGGQSAIGRITTAGAITEYPIDATLGTYTAIVAAPDGTLWITGQAGVLARVSTAGSVSSIPATDLTNPPAGLAVGPDGAIWFTEQVSLGTNSAIIGRIDSSGAIRELTLPQGTLPPFALTAGPDGNLWIAVPGQGSVLRYEPSGHITVYVVSADGWLPDALQFAPDGTLWVGASPPLTTPGADGRVYHITP